MANCCQNVRGNKTNKDQNDKNKQTNKQNKNKKIILATGLRRYTDFLDTQDVGIHCDAAVCHAIII